MAGCAAQFVAKQLIDIIVSALALLILSPLLLLIALLIRLDSNGPAFFRQKRQGLGGRSFWMWKFRTMTLDAEDRLGELEHLNEVGGGVLFKIRRDPRITRVGRFLRWTSLDELPQLFNVLMGHMSLVGPRPLPLRDSELLRRKDEELYARRLSVLPGVTGPWQVSGRSEVATDGMLELDLDYIDNWSLWWDFRLLARTFFVVLGCRGSY
jgi:lipopolysaccharide/colanic/teichoic acid biosynthesis glycosyltransferase